MNRFDVDAVAVAAAVRTSAIDLMASHVSVREFAADQPVSEDAIRAMVTAAQSASNSSNMQSWSVVEVRDPERKSQLASLCSNQVFIREAPVFLVFCPDLYRIRWVVERQGYRYDGAFFDQTVSVVIDTALAGQNAATAAESLGLGCCIVGGVRDKPEEVAALLELPPGVFPAFGMAVGWPAARNPVKGRLPQAAVWHRERYDQDAACAGVVGYDQRLGESALYKGRRVQVPGQTPPPEQDTGPYGWIEHSARRMALKGSVRRSLAGFLRRHGFGLD